MDPDRFFQVVGDGVRRGHSFKLFKKRYRLDVGKFKFASRVCEEWNRLGDGIVSAAGTPEPMGQGGQLPPCLSQQGARGGKGALFQKYNINEIFKSNYVL